MKILQAVICQVPDQINHGSLLWCSRAGFQTKIFIPEEATAGTELRNQFEAAVEDANYKEYLDLNKDMLVTDANALKYAQDNDFDVLVLVPPDLERWNTRKTKNLMIIDYAADVGAVRKQMGGKTTLHDMTFDNGTRIVRVVKI